MSLSRSGQVQARFQRLRRCFRVLASNLWLLGLLSCCVCSFQQISHTHGRMLHGRLKMFVKSGWNLVAEIVTDEVGERVSFEPSNTNYLLSNNLDFSSPREWMEYLQSSGKAPVGGAYTVIRCDFIPVEERWIIWGEHHHMNRLQSSYETLSLFNSKTDRSPLVSEAALDEATTNSYKLMKALLDGAEAAVLSDSSFLPGRNISDPFVFTMMISLLWVPRDAEGNILVSGHICMGNRRIQTEGRDPKPINVAVALSQNRSCCLPNRYDYFPKAKLSSWCGRRRPLESAFMVHGIGEVLLLKEDRGKLNILEGLTSNFFVVYRTGILKTADEDVLHGYAREIVLDCARRCGLVVECSPISLEDSNEWEECFLTSAVRLIVPIKSILVPNNQQENLFKELWSTKSKASELKTWRMILDEMLRTRGQ